MRWTLAVIPSDGRLRIVTAWEGRGFYGEVADWNRPGSVSSGSYSLDDEHADKLGSPVDPRLEHSLTKGELGLLTD